MKTFKISQLLSLAVLLITAYGPAALHAETEVGKSPPPEAIAKAEVQPAEAIPVESAVEVWRSQAHLQLIRPGDLVNIRMKEDPDVLYEGKVSAAGLVTLPFLGHVTLAGIEERAAEEHLEKALTARLYERATMSVTVLQRAAGQIHVYGAVQAPGKVDLPEYGSINVMQTLSDVGGVTRWAAPEQAYILRQQPGSTEMGRVPVNLREVFMNVTGKENVMMQAGDILFVPATIGGWDAMLSRESVEVIVTGQVNDPGAVTFSPGERATFLRAIFKAGNFSKHAGRHNVRWVRYKDGGERTVKEIDAEAIMAQGHLDADFELESGDMIIVSQTPGHLYVYGAVQEPGRVELPANGERPTVMQVLSEVGGVSKWAAPKRAYVMRRETGQDIPTRIEVNIEEAFSNIGGRENMQLHANDVLFVPAATGPFDAILSNSETEIIVTGAVNAPGMVKFQPGEDCTFVRAIFKAGNFTQYAKEDKVRWIHHGEDGSRQVTEVNAARIIQEGELNQDFELSAGDMIIVPRSRINF